MNVMVCSRLFCAFQGRKTDTDGMHNLQNSYQRILNGTRKNGRILSDKMRRGFAWAGVKRAQPHRRELKQKMHKNRDSG